MLGGLRDGRRSRDGESSLLCAGRRSRDGESILLCVLWRRLLLLLLVVLHWCECPRRFIWTCVRDEVVGVPGERRWTGWVSIYRG